jgi:uncharacterized membrane protein
MTSLEPSTLPAEETGQANIIYILYLVGLVTFGLVGVIGVIMAYSSKSTAGPLLTSHYNNQINLFWKMLVYSLASAVLVFALGLGLLTGLVATVWFVIRCVKGIEALGARREIANPGSWWL